MDNDEQRDPAEEAYNANILRDQDAPASPTSPKRAAELADGDVFSIDGGRTWCMASGIDMTWGGSISAYAMPNPRNIGRPNADCVRHPVPADGMVLVPVRIAGDLPDAEGIAETLAEEFGIEDAWVFDPGPGTVQVPVPDGSVFLCDREGFHPRERRGDSRGGFVIGRRFDDGRGEQTLFYGGARLSEAVTMLVVYARAARASGDTAGPRTSTGHDVAQAAESCAWGDGEAVGLPTPDNAVSALLLFAQHVDHDPDHCLVRALATTTCRECSEDTGTMGIDGVMHHVVWWVSDNPQRGWVLTGCEGYVEAALRAAAVCGRRCT